MDLKTMETIEKVTKNADILQNIFEMLSLKDQIKTTAVCKEFEYVIENFIWKLKCKDIKIHATSKNYLRLCDAANTEHDLKEDEAKMFFHIIAKYIEKLQIIDGEKNILFNTYYNFEKLSTLQFKHMNVTKNHLQFVVKNCANLETINFHNWINFTRYLFLSNIEVLSKLKFLKHFKFTANGFFNSTLLISVFNNLKLTTLALECKHLYCIKRTDLLKTCTTLEELTMGTFEDADTWLGFQEIYFKKLPNLTTLSLNGKGVEINDKNILKLANTCKKLQNLTLKNCQINIKDFPSQLNLKKLTLEGCKHLSWKNLQDILSLYNLEEFITLNTIYEGELDLSNINVNQSLNILEITTEQTQEFLRFLKSINNKLENLKILRYHFNEFSPQNKLENIANLCPNLKELYLKNIVISIDDLMKLCNLKLLRFNLFSSMCWTFMATLLKHPSVSYLSLGMTAEMAELVYNKTLELTILKEEFNAIPYNASEFNTNFQFIKVPFIIFHQYQNVFLDLLGMKKYLKLMLFGFNSRTEMVSQTFLHQLLNHKKFPSHLKTIKICNKYFDCQDLRENFDSSLEEFSNIYHCTICFNKY